MVGALARHAVGDWGQVEVEDWATNDWAVVDGTRLLSAYRTADRSASTLLLPEEY